MAAYRVNVFGALRSAGLRGLEPTAIPPKSTIEAARLLQFNDGVVAHSRPIVQMKMISLPGLCYISRTRTRDFHWVRLL